MLSKTISWRSLGLGRPYISVVCIGLRKLHLIACSLSSYTCMYWSSKTSTPSQSEIFSLLVHKQGNKQCIGSDLREYFTSRGCAGLGRPMHTYKQREQAIKWSFHNVQFIGRMAGAFLPYKISCVYVLARVSETKHCMDLNF